MKQIIIDGRLGRDAEIRTTNTGKPYVSFSMAVNTFAGGQEKTEWFDVTSFDPFIVEKKLAILKKGSYVIVTGTFQADTSVKDGKVYLNQRVNAVSVDAPSLGKPQQDGQTQAYVQPQMTTGVPTPTVQAPQVQAPTVQAPVVTMGANQPQMPQMTTGMPQQVAQPVAQPQAQQQVYNAPVQNGISDDLPF